MKVLLTAVNAKYILPNLALYDLRVYTEAFPGTQYTSTFVMFAELETF